MGGHNAMCGNGMNNGIRRGMNNGMGWMTNGMGGNNGGVHHMINFS